MTQLCVFAYIIWGVRREILNYQNPTRKFICCNTMITFASDMQFMVNQCQKQKRHKQTGFILYNQFMGHSWEEIISSLPCLVFYVLVRSSVANIIHNIQLLSLFPCFMRQGRYILACVIIWLCILSNIMVQWQRVFTLGVEYCGFDC